MLKKIKQILKRTRNSWLAFKTKNVVASYQKPLYVNGKSYFTPFTSLGSNCHFNGMHISGSGRVMIGDNFHSGSECQIITQNHNINGDALPYDDTYVVKDVIIGHNVWFGNRVMVMAGVSIGEGAVIQAGSVVVSDIPPLSIAGGHPAKVFSQRDITHYQYLRKQCKFH